MRLNGIWLPFRRRKYFVSHSYADASLGLIEQLMSDLPPNKRAFIFPPINVPPERRVSDDLISAILDCDGLIYIDSDNSKKSVWVNFEVDFARRNGLPVYKYNPALRTLAQEWTVAINSNILSFTFGDWSRARPLRAQVNSLLENRNFTLVQGVSSEDEDPSVFEDLVNNASVYLGEGAPMIIFVCNGSAHRFNDYWMLCAKLAGYRAQRLFAVLEPLQGDKTFFDIALLDSSDAISLYHPTRPLQIDWRRVDDLIVRSFSLLHRAREKMDRERAVDGDVSVSDRELLSRGSFLEYHLAKAQRLYEMGDLKGAIDQAEASLAHGYSSEAVRIRNAASPLIKNK